MLTLINIYEKVKVCGKFIVKPVINIVAFWILITGFWDDNGVWDDTKNWLDNI